MSHKWLKFECLLLFAAFPLTLALLKPHSWIYITLWLVALLAWRVLQKEGYTLRGEWNWKALDAAVFKHILRRFVPIALLLLLFTWFVVPDRLFSLPLERPTVWVMVMLLYPLLSGIPQEVVFRSYFFRRYAPLFSTPRAMMIASACAFGWVHIVLLNWVAVVFSAIAGLFFADTYARTKSLAAVCFEHALYGCFIFTIGLGVYFYHGQAVR